MYILYGKILIYMITMNKKSIILDLVGYQLAVEILSLINAHFPGRIIDSIIENSIHKLILYLCILVVCEIGLNTIIGYCTAKKNCWYHLQRNLTSSVLARKFGSLRLDIFEKNVVAKRPNLETYISREAPKVIAEAISGGFFKIVVSIFLICINPFFTIYSIGAIGIMAVLGAAAEMLYTKYDFELKESYAKTTERMHRALWSMTQSTYAKEIRVFNLERFLTAKFNKARESLYHLYTLKNRKGMKIDLLSALSDGLCLFASFGFAVMVIGENCTVGTFFITANVTQLVFKNIYYISKNVVVVYRESKYIKKLNSFLKENDGWHSEFDKLSGEIQAIEFRDVSFAYPDTQKVALDGLSFKIKKGERIALVGENGAGKSTVVKLLSGLYRPNKGKILIDGKDLEEMDVASYHRLFSVVYQDAVTFDYSICENIAMNEMGEYLDSYVGSKLDLITSQIGFNEKIESLGRGYKSMLSRRFDTEGINLSGGECQKLLLARALYKDSSFLIFDEPTASMSPAAEHEMYEIYRKMTAGKTAVYISHRLAGCRMSDRILVIKDGRVAENGTHEALMTIKDGIYRKMFMTQAKGYMEG